MSGIYDLLVLCQNRSMEKFLEGLEQPSVTKIIALPDTKLDNEIKQCQVKNTITTSLKSSQKPTLQPSQEPTPTQHNSSRKVQPKRKSKSAPARL